MVDHVEAAPVHGVTVLHVVQEGAQLRRRRRLFISLTAACGRNFNAVVMTHHSSSAPASGEYEDEGGSNVRRHEDVVMEKL